MKAGWRLENVGVPTSSKSELVVLGGETSTTGLSSFFMLLVKQKPSSYHFATRVLGYLSPRSFFRLTLDLLKPTECGWRRPPPASLVGGSVLMPPALFAAARGAKKKEEFKK